MTECQQSSVYYPCALHLHSKLRQDKWYVNNSAGIWDKSGPTEAGYRVFQDILACLISSHQVYIQLTIYELEKNKVGGRE